MGQNGQIIYNNSDHKQVKCCARLLHPHAEIRFDPNRFSFHTSGNPGRMGEIPSLSYKYKTYLGLLDREH